jgi:uncharacterized protein YndB with AHSA1/START domain
MKFLEHVREMGIDGQSQDNADAVMIELEFHIPLPAATVWEFLALDEHLQQWWGKGVTLEPRQNGGFIARWTDEKGKKHFTIGRVTAIEPEVRLQMDWQDTGWKKPTRVEFLLSKVSNGTRVYLQHSGWDIFGGKERRKKVDEQQETWMQSMEKFRRYCEGAP